MVISFTIPDAVFPRVLAALSEGQPSDSPLTPGQFSKQVVTNFIFSKVSNYEARQAMQTAGATAQAQTKTDIVIT